MKGIEIYLLDKFIVSVNELEVDPLLLDKFFHDGYYDSMSDSDQNLETLTLFLENHV